MSGEWKDTAMALIVDMDGAPSILCALGPDFSCQIVIIIVLSAGYAIDQSTRLRSSLFFQSSKDNTPPFRSEPVFSMFD